MLQPVVLFDAVGTLIYPFPAAVQAYQATANKHGISVTDTELKQRFLVAFNDQFARSDHLYSVPSSEEIERSKWNQVVRQVFQDSYTDELFGDLWNHFAASENWRCFDDAQHVIDGLSKMGFQIGIASNFDQRLKPIVSDTIPQLDSSMVFCSSEIGFAKPDVRFFKTIEQDLKRKLNRINPLMIGDHWKLDFDAASRAGWKAIWKSGDNLPTLDDIQNHFLRSR